MARNRQLHQVYDPTAASVPVQAARWLLFEAFRSRDELRPVLEGLRDDVLPVYRRSREAVQTPGQRRLLDLWAEAGLLDEPVSAAVEPARRVHLNWAERWHLQYDWAISLAWQIVKHWQMFPHDAAVLELPNAALAVVSEPSAVPTPGNLILPRWLPEAGESWEQFQALTNQLFEAWLTEQHEFGRQLLKSGWRELPQRREALEAYVILAFYTCFGEAPEEIAKHPHLCKDKSNIFRSIQETAALTGMRMRRPGRPRKRCASS